MAIVTVDFDGTLYQGNSFKVMFQVGKKQFTMKQWSILFSGLVKAGAVGLANGKNAFRHQFFKAFAKTFQGKTTSELDVFFQELVDVGKAEVHQSLVLQIQKHQQNGDTVILLSGALQPFLRAFAKELQLDVHIISTELLFDQRNLCTGEIGQIINGDEKVNKLQEWLEARSMMDQPSQEIWAYADSESDIPLLNFVTNPVVVNPKDDMKKIAQQNKWTIFAS
ncbi:haloacid dehalogenase-like hydrolase [Bacillus luteolus]|uniref:Haloacid dehalogenase-like hydrolase n=1 Tax=Litchfieldia luteola TaxID=682179 RepID=A0ABR9QGQ9_9BACI|nr:HAD family hydrolase [Cytobacillus luteolus]MBE4907687.1 haloacid dehalogenase-like hydrolase [Cytobacillus luteolus]MBP1941138.1 HAD superfamily hydrolase (TIGR01490 family) [Cytobacillus luteolus]